MSDDEQEIRNLIKTWFEATKRNDTKQVLSLMSEDVVFYIAGREPMRGRAEFGAAQSGLAEVDFEAEYEIQEIRILNDFAYCCNHIKISVTPKSGGQAHKRSGYALSILQRTAENGWVIIRDANMLAAQN